MKVDLLSGGFFTAPAGVWRRGDELDRMVRFPIPVYLIDTGEERILVDAGLHPDAVADPGAHYGASEALAMFTFELERTLAERGKEAELKAVNQWLPRPGKTAYTRQQEPLGLGHAVWCARGLVGDEPFAVLLADDLILSQTPCLAQMVEAHAAVGGNMIAVMDVPQAHVKRYGIVAPGKDDGRLVEVKGLVEKPAPDKAPSAIAVIGRYVLEPAVFEYLERGLKGAGNEIQLTDALASRLGKSPFHGYRFEGKRFDCGDKVGFFEAQIAFALAREDIGPAARDVLKAYT